MRKGIWAALWLSALVILALSGCGSSGDGVQIDYGTSAIYTREDMDAAIAVIQQEFQGWKGCRLHSIRYTDDSCNSEATIRWLSELEGGRGFSQCIRFESEFHTPVFGADAPGFGESDEVKGWQWYLGRVDGGDWRLLLWGKE